MHLDLRYPIGLLLTTYGVILAVEGAIVQATVLGLNVNLYLGRRHDGMRSCGALPGPTEGVMRLAGDVDGHRVPCARWQTRVSQSPGRKP